MEHGGAFSAAGIIHGFENTWGPWWIPDEDQEGMKYLLTLKDFFTNIVEFHRLKPETKIIDQSMKYEPGTRPLCMSTSERDAFLVYLPVGGSVSLSLPEPSNFESFWYNPRTGKMKEASGTVKGETVEFRATDKDDWVLILRKCY